jgi:hypothetical protein
VSNKHASASATKEKKWLPFVQFLYVLSNFSAGHDACTIGFLLLFTGWTMFSVLWQKCELPSIKYEYAVITSLRFLDVRGICAELWVKNQGIRISVPGESQHSGNLQNRLKFRSAFCSSACEENISNAYDTLINILNLIINTVARPKTASAHPWRRLRAPTARVQLTGWDIASVLDRVARVQCFLTAELQ